MRQSAERLVADDPPTPDQLFKLAAQGILVAKQYNVLRSKRSGRGMVLPTQVTLPLDQEDLRDRRYEHTWSHSVTKTDFRKWSMRLISRYHVIEVNEGIGTEVQMYKFEWNPNHTLLTSKETTVAPVPEYDLGDLIDRFHVDDDMADEWQWREQLTQVTAGDVALLLRELETFSGRVAFSDMITNR